MENSNLLYENFESFGEDGVVKKILWNGTGESIVSISDDKFIRIFDRIPDSSLQLEDHPQAEILQEENKQIVQPEMEMEDCEERKESFPLNLKCISEIKSSSFLYDMCLLESIGSDNELLCTCSMNNPIQIWSMNTKKYLYSISAKNHLEVAISPICVTPHSLHHTIYAGYYQKLIIYDLNKILEKTIIELKKGKKKEKTYVSSISLNIYNENMFAFGTYNKQIFIRDERSNKNIKTLNGHFGGITHLQFTKDGNYLFSGGRRDQSIFSWDLRTFQIIQNYHRKSDTNQRIIFDIDDRQQYLATGNLDGSIVLFDINNNKVHKCFGGHFDSIPCVSFNPWNPDILASSSGQRHYLLPQESTAHKKDLPVDSSQIQETLALSPNSDTDTDTDSEKELKQNIKFINGIRIWSL